MGFKCIYVLYYKVKRNNLEGDVREDFGDIFLIFVKVEFNFDGDKFVEDIFLVLEFIFLWFIFKDGF